MTAIAALVGRILIAVLFISSGASKIMTPDATGAMMESAGLSSALAMPVGIFEVVAGLAIVVGFMTRLFALLLAGFTLLATLLFHNQLTDPMQQIMAIKNLAIVGGLLCLFAISQMRWSYDSMRLRRKGEHATHDADARAHEAELRAARAEGRADAFGSAIGTTGSHPVTSADRDGDGVADRPRRRRWF